MVEREWWWVGRREREEKEGKMVMGGWKEEEGREGWRRMWLEERVQSLDRREPQMRVEMAQPDFDL